MVKSLSPLFRNKFRNKFNISAICALSMCVIALTGCQKAVGNKDVQSDRAEEKSSTESFFCELPFTNCEDEKKDETKNDDKTNPETEPKERLVLNIAPLSETSIDIINSAPASVVSLNSSTIKAELSANIISMNVRVGDNVKKGDVLAKLNCSDARVQLAQAQARITSANAQLRANELELKRTKTLNQKRSISESILTQRQAAYDAALGDYQASIAARNLSRNQVKRCALVAPYDAIVTHRIGQVGELATFGSPIVKLVSSRNAEITADILPKDANSLAQASSIEFESRAHRYEVSLRHIVSAVDNSKRTQEARLVFKNSNTAPLAGTPGRLIWKGANKGIPSKYFTERNNQLGVFVIENQIALFTPLPTAQAGRPVAVDWSSDVVIVTTGQHGLKDKQDISELIKD